jgi:endoglucanase
MLQRVRTGRRTRRLLLVAVCAITTAAYGWATTNSGAAGPTLSIAISGNHFVNEDGQTIRLLGVDAPSTEYACDQGWGYSSEPLTEATALAIASWHADSVRVPLNEDCWLGLNGQPSYGTQAGYQQAIESWVADLNAAGLSVILDLHWSAPGTVNADGQRPMPNDHSAAFWTSVAAVFKDNPAVVFDAFNEPYSPAANGDSSLAVSWSCWRNGGCPVPVASDGSTVDDSDTYVAVGLQALVTAIRATGASQPILLGGLSYANDLSGWIANEPTDPDNQLAASFHNYYGESCDGTACWNSTVATVAAQVPVVTGEFDQGYDCADPPTAPSSLTTFDQTFMNWADQNGVSYLAWGWWVLGNTSTTCSALGGGGDNYALISDYSGTAVSPDGLNLYLHLAALSSAPSLQITTESLPTASVKASYSTTLAARAGNPPYSWSLPSGVLPRGLHLTSAGLIKGKPKVGGTFPFTVEVKDTSTSAHAQQTATRTISLTVTQPTPTIAAVRPSSGPDTGGTRVTIVGASLEGATSVSFGGTRAASFTVNAAGSRLRVRDPKVEASGTVPITVTTPGGINGASTVASFTYR